MRVTIIPSDKTIIVDGKGVVLDNWNFNDSDIHAIQWYHNYGVIEYTRTDMSKPRPDNQRVEDEDLIAKYVDAYYAEIPKIEQLKLKRAEEERLRLEKEKQDLAKGDLLRKELEKQVQEQIEQNKMLRAEKLRIEAEKAEQELKLADEQRLRELERQRLELEKAQVEAGQKEAEREKYWNEHFRKQNEEIQKAHLELSKQAERYQEEFQKQLEFIESKRNLMETQLDEERTQLKATQEFLKSERDLTEKSIHAELDRVKLLNETIEKKREIAQEEIRLANEDLRSLQAEVLARREASEREIEVLLEKNSAERLRIQEEAKSRELSTSANLAELNAQIAAAEKRMEEVKLQTTQLQKYREQIEQELKERVDIVETQTYEQIKKKAIESLVEDHQLKEITEKSKEIAENKINEILHDTNPYEILPLLVTTGADGENANDIDFPIEAAIKWFTNIKRLKDLSIKYNIPLSEVKKAIENGEL